MCVPGTRLPASIPMVPCVICSTIICPGIRLADPEKHMEAKTSRPMLQNVIGRLTDALAPIKF